MYSLLERSILNIFNYIINNKRLKDRTKKRYNK